MAGTMAARRRRTKGTPTLIGSVVASVLRASGVGDRVEQAAVMAQWPELVGERIAKVAEPELVTPDGVLFVRVRSAAWRQELSLMTPSIIARLNAGRTAGRIEGIRWMLGAARG